MFTCGTIIANMTNLLHHTHWDGEGYVTSPEVSTSNIINRLDYNEENDVVSGSSARNEFHEKYNEGIRERCRSRSRNQYSTTSKKAAKQGNHHKDGFKWKQRKNYETTPLSLSHTKIVADCTKVTGFQLKNTAKHYRHCFWAWCSSHGGLILVRN